MIKQENLRLANCFIDPEFPNIISRVEQLHSMAAVGSYNDGISYESMEPILITPRMLEKIGFKFGATDGIASFNVEFESSPEDVTYYWDMRVAASEYCDHFTFSLVKWGEQNEFTFSFQNLRVRIRHLHQLQNLFFAMTNKEMNVQECDATES